MLAIAFALLEQATAAATTITTATTDTANATTGVTATGSIDNQPISMPRNTTADSSKVSQKGDSVEHISPDSLTKDVPLSVPSKPEPKPSNLNPITNTQNKETDCSVSPDGTGNASGNKDNMNTYQNISEENFPAPHILPASVQFDKHSKESTNIVENFESNPQ